MCSPSAGVRGARERDRENESECERKLPNTFIVQIFKFLPSKVYATVHLPLCLLHGAWLSQEPLRVSASAGNTVNDDVDDDSDDVDDSDDDDDDDDDCDNISDDSDGDDSTVMMLTISI